MTGITESDLLRLAMILENQGQTTLEKYLCKLIECVLFDSINGAMTSIEIYQEIYTRFQLQFDILEIENTIKNKGKGRITFDNGKYSLEPKVINQLSIKTTSIDQLKQYVDKFVSTLTKAVDKDYFLKLLLGFLYYSFNSNLKNFINIIGVAPSVLIDKDSQKSFNPTNDEIALINSFVAWDNDDKNKLFYSIVACSYEYCMITTKKNPTISKKVFSGKRFYLDTNIIFRMAGINKDDRRFVIKSFIDKCNEVGIKLYYTNEVLDELYRVIDGQVSYIKSITLGQPPVSNEILENLNSSYENNDFYTIYCNWCKEPQNKYHDYISFRDYLIKLVQETISELDLINIINYKNSDESKTFSALFEGLKQYKSEKRPFRKTSDASVKTDVNNLIYVASLRSTKAESIWQINDYIVSADQIFTNWSKLQFAGVPTVMIPSIWLSIILKVSGRTSNDDYKSYCLFLELRQHRTTEDEININPINLLRILSARTVEKELKEKIISEIIINKSEYSFGNEADYDESVEKAFDKILLEEKSLQKSELAKAAADQAKAFKNERDEYEKKLSERQTEEEYAKRFAENRAIKNITKYKESDNIRLIFLGVSVIIALIVVASIFIKIPLLHDLFTGTGKSTSSLWTAATWIFTVITGSISTYITAVWKYMGSNDRQSKLYKKYYKEQVNNLKPKDN